MAGWTYDNSIGDIREMTPAEAWHNKKARALASMKKVEPVKPGRKIPPGMLVVREEFVANDEPIMPEGYARAMALDTMFRRIEGGTLT